MKYALARVPSIVSAPGARHKIGRALQSMASSGAVMIIADPAMQRLGFTADIEAGLRAAGYDPLVALTPDAEPKAAAIDALIEQSVAIAPAAYVGVGGGSALDILKIVAASAGQPVKTYEAAVVPFPPRRIPLIALPSTSGTGAEATRTAVYTNAEGDKTWCWDNNLLPDAVLLDPELTYKLPPHLTAATGLDAFVHAFEAATNRFSEPLSSTYCVRAIELAREHLPTAVASGEHTEARAAMQLAACYAGVGITNAQTALAHNIGHALGSLVPIHHGRAVATALAETMDWSISTAPARFETAAKAFFGGQDGGIADFAGGYRYWMESLGVTVDLQDTGLARFDVATLLGKMENSHNTPMLESNHRRPAGDELRDIAERVLALA